MDFSAAEIAALIGGGAEGNAARRFHEVVIDSRRVRPGCLFVALPGARVDGHDFVAAAFAAGAGGALVTRDVPDGIPGEAVVIRCADATAALQGLGSAWRDRLRGTVVGVAGSNGKTTTKEALARVLAEAGSVFATPGNENSQVGAPTALLAVPADTRFVVLELGTSQPGELARLAAMARPDHAVITAAFAEHLEWLRDVDGVVAAETEILGSTRAGGLALVGSAEPKLVAAAQRYEGLRVRSLGTTTRDDWQIGDLRLTREGTRFRLAGKPEALPEVERREWHVPLLGPPAAWAAGFAIALARNLGMTPEAIQAGLARLRPAAHRLAPAQHPERPLLVIDDCYNSNPASCIAAIETAAELSAPRDRLILVLGDMLELGEATRDAHREVGEAVPRCAPRSEALVTVGAASLDIASAAGAAGVPVHPVHDADEAIPLLRSLLEDRSRRTTVLVKASRGVGLDRLVAALLAS